MTRPCWIGRAVRNRHHHAIEQASRRWRGGRRGDPARTRRKILISTQVTRQQNWASLRQGIVVWLDPDVETLTARLSSGDEAGKRPLLQQGDVGATLAATLEKRREFYEQCDVRVSIQGEENASDTAARVVADALAFIRANPPKAAPGPPE